MEFVDHETKILANFEIKQNEKLSDEEKELCYMLIGDMDKCTDVVLLFDDNNKMYGRLYNAKIYVLMDSLQKYGAAQYEENDEYKTIVDIFCADYNRAKFVSLKTGEDAE